jgi:hypothetical protein
MTGPQHYKEAERILAGDALEALLAGGLEPHEAFALAQVHATLALVAATAYQAVKDYYGDEGRESRGWALVTS